MNLSGILLGLVSFLCIGLFHPLVIKGEYYFGTKCWWVFACVGIAMLIGSLFTSNIYIYLLFLELLLFLVSGLFSNYSSRRSVSNVAGSLQTPIANNPFTLPLAISPLSYCNPWIFDNLVEIHVYFLDSADERSEC